MPVIGHPGRAPGLLARFTVVAWIVAFLCDIRIDADMAYSLPILIRGHIDKMNLQGRFKPKRNQYSTTLAQDK